MRLQEKIKDRAAAVLDRIVLSVPHGPKAFVRRIDRKLLGGRLHRAIRNARDYDPTATADGLLAEIGRTNRGSPRISRQYGQARKDRKAAIRVVETVTDLHRYKSLTPGVPEWEDKWDGARGRRVLMFAPVDYSGSFYKWADAINKHTAFAARLITLFRHRFQYPLDLLFPPGKPLTGLFPLSYYAILRLADEADVIFIKDQTGFAVGRNDLPQNLFTQFGKPMIFTHYGGTARKDQGEEWYREYVCSFDAVVAMTPDLCFDWVESHYIPHSVDVDQFPVIWEDGNRVCHTPSTKERKGTAEFLSAMEGLAPELGLEVEVIHGVSHEMCLARKQGATLFFDQAGRERDDLGGRVIGWYGNSALEAAVAGIPFMAHLSPAALREANARYSDFERKCPVINVDTTSTGIADKVRWFFQELSATSRRDLSERTRRWIEEFHSQQAVGRSLSSVLEKALLRRPAGGEATSPRGTRRPSEHVEQ